MLLLGAGSLCWQPAHAQDRSVPRFGSLVAPDTVTAGQFDLGRLWSVAEPPLDYIEQQYGVRADARGLRHARLATVRLPNCSGALVSPQGLMLTAARCVRAFLPHRSDSARAASFYADTQAQEKPLPGLYAERLVEVDNVTARVDSVQGEGRTVVRDRMQRQAPDDHQVEVVPEAGGARYVAYTYRRIEDVRLAFRPDRAVTVLGRLGQPLTYPQHAWDVAVLRLYEEGEPLQTDRHFELRAQGVRPGDAVFAMGYPSSIPRAETADQLAFRRDVQLPARQAALAAWTAQLQQYADTASSPGGWTDRKREARATHRHVAAQLDGLQNDYVMRRLEKRDRELAQQEGGKGAPAADVQEWMDQLASIQEEKRALADRYRAFRPLLHPEYSSATLRRALLAYREKQGKASADLDEALQSISSQPAALDAAALAGHVDRLEAAFASDTTLMDALEQLPPAQSLVRSSVFSDSAQARTRIEENNIPEADPAIQLVSAFYDRYADFNASWTELVTREKRLTDSLSRLRHRRADPSVALPQSRSIRGADGRVQGYPYNGTLAPPFTTFYGLYGQHYAAPAAERRALPSRWQSPPAPFERSTPLVMAAGTDLGGQTYGGPLLNTSLQLVGLVFDGNVQSAAGEYLFLPRRMRTVAVDVRGVLEGLSSVYGADRLVGEMTDESASR